MAAEQPCRGEKHHQTSKQSPKHDENQVKNCTKIATLAPVFSDNKDGEDRLFGLTESHLIQLWCLRLDSCLHVLI